MKPDAQRLFAEAARLRQAGQLAEAALLYRRILAADPGHADSLHMLGLVEYLQGRPGEAIAGIEKAIAADGTVADYHSNLGLILSENGRKTDAVESLRRALALEPGLAEGWNNLGNVLGDQDRFDDAADAYRKALALAPGQAAIHVNLAHVLRRQARLDEAVSAYRRALGLAPDDIAARTSLGDTLRQQGRLEQAQAEYHKVLDRRPRTVAALNGLSATARARGDLSASLAAIRQALALEDTAQTRRLFAALLLVLPPQHFDEELRLLTARAIAEAWDIPARLARLAADLLRPLLSRDASPEALAADPLLAALLVCCPNCDLELEKALVAARRGLLEAALADTGDVALLAFHSALARQCFINEYVFSVAMEEAARADQARARLAAALQAGEPVSSSLVAAVASYFPLNSLAEASQLASQSWPQPVDAILTQQLREPAEEARLREGVARLTSVADAGSLGVRAQYEENPYPRWVRISAEPGPEGAGQDRDILVAGCGTGQYLVQLGLQSPGARIAAVDLSLASLAYARRKALEHDLGNAEFAQADLLELGGWDRRFDMIECGGVLHFLDDPFAAWQLLLGLLRPGGLMRVAVYSALGRRSIDAARRYLGPHAGPVTPGIIRHAREKLAAAPDNVFADLVASADFYSVSGCRNLLFLAQERRLGLDAIAAFLAQNRLRFLGFSVEDAVLALYRQRFPDDPDATDLSRWQAFERSHPDTFIGMYQFWVRKDA